MTQSSTDDHHRTLSRRHFLALTGAAGTLLGMPGISRWAWAEAEPKPCDYLANAWSEAVQARLASRQHRLHHFLWHALRNNWSDLSDDQRRKIAALGWAPRRPALVKPRWDTGKLTRSHWVVGPAGEDFLHFHRWMIAVTDGWLVQEGKNPLAAWSRKDVIPPPGGGSGCPDEVVPDFVPVFEDGGSGIVVPFLQTRVRELKTDAFYWNRMAWWDGQFKDRAYLRTMTLGELGARLELSVHNQMHIRWSAYPSGGGRRLRQESDIDRRWDSPGYDTLFDEYSSHATPIFFRIHKWIDNRIEDWAEAHADHVSPFRTPQGFRWYRDRDGGQRWVQVRDPWPGAFGLDHTHDPHSEDDRIRIMEKTHRILFNLPEGALLAAPGTPVREIVMLKDLF